MFQMGLHFFTTKHFLPSHPNDVQAAPGGILPKVALGFAVFGSLLVLSLSAATVSAPWTTYKNSMSPIAGVTVDSTITLSLTEAQICSTVTGSAPSSSCQSFGFSDASLGFTSGVQSSFKTTKSLCIAASVVGALSLVAAAIVMLGEFDFPLGPLAAQRRLLLIACTAAPLIAVALSSAAAGVWSSGVVNKLFDGSGMTDGNGGLSAAGYSKAWAAGFAEDVTAVVFGSIAAAAALAAQYGCKVSGV